MKLGFYISMGIAITGLIVGFILLNDIQQEKDNQNIWIQKIPTQCNDVWSVEYDQFFESNPKLADSESNKSEILETIIKNHYKNEGLKILDLKLELDVIDDPRCDSCDCLGHDKLSLKIPKNQLGLLPPDEGWEEID
jgi:hypothetical protein